MAITTKPQSTKLIKKGGKKFMALPPAEHEVIYSKHEFNDAYILPTGALHPSIIETCSIIKENATMLKTALFDFMRFAVQYGNEFEMLKGWGDDTRYEISSASDLFYRAISKCEAIDWKTIHPARAAIELNDICRAFAFYYRDGRSTKSNVEIFQVCWSIRELNGFCEPNRERGEFLKEATLYHSVAELLERLALSINDRIEEAEIKSV